MRIPRSVQKAIATCSALFALVSSAPPAAAEPSGVKVVARDARGDVDPGPAGIEDIGTDLLKASIGVEGDNILFILDAAELAPGANYALAPTFFEWYFSVGDGDCVLPVHGSCRHFSIWGPCLGLSEEVGLTFGFLTCDVGQDPMTVVIQDDTLTRITAIARIEDRPGGQRIIFPVPRDFIAASAGAVIRPGRHRAYSNPEGPLFAHTGYWFLYPNGMRGITPRDAIDWQKPYRVP